MILGVTSEMYEEKYKNKYPNWIFDVVNNKSTSIDVDKFDYL